MLTVQRDENGCVSTCIDVIARAQERKSSLLSDVRFDALDHIAQGLQGWPIILLRSELGITGIHPHLEIRKSSCTGALSLTLGLPYLAAAHQSITWWQRMLALRFTMPFPDFASKPLPAPTLVAGELVNPHRTPTFLQFRDHWLGRPQTML